MKKLLASLYVLLTLITYGHYWNNTDLKWGVLEKPAVTFIVSIAHPLYWPTIIFEKED